MKKLFVSLFVFVLAFPGFFSCQTLNLLQEPRLSLKTVDLENISFSGVDLIAHVNVENPNSFDLPFPKIGWELFINSGSFIRGELDKGVVIKKRRTTTVPVRFSFSWEGLYKSISSLVEKKEAGYDITLDITFPLPIIQDKTFHLEWSGEIPLIEIPKISQGSFKIEKIDFSGIELACGLNIENLNSFPIPFPNIEWKYAAAGVPIINSVLKQEGKLLPPKTVSQVDLMVSVNYAELIRSVPSLANIGEAPALLALNSVFEFPASDDIKNYLEMPGTLPILKMPQFSVRSISIKDLALLRFEFIVNMEIENRNSFAMNIDKFNYNFMVNDRMWASGAFLNPPVIRPGTRTALPLTIVIESLSMVREIQDIISKGSSVNYTCTGDIALSSDFPAFPKFNMPINISGSSRLLR